MADIDNRVVSIRFDNAEFERKISETIRSLEKLRHSLDFSTATRSLENLKSTGANSFGELKSAGSKFNMEPIHTAIDGVSAKFAAMATIGITALANLTNKVVEAGITMAKSLTIEPIGQGFAEFELKMGSIQTIMAGSGESLDVVNKKLQELNAYSDRTIYSFKDMTSNIGKFTNAGVSLDDSVGAIQGVANVAALAGANSEEASRAMYNFAQALSTGSVKLIDWKSIELANMGTVEFKQQIIDTAVAMGTLTKASDGTIKTLEGTEVTTKNFQSTLQDAWFTSDVLTDVLGKYSDVTTDVGKRASAAATEIKTFSQMISTMKESVGSGWSMTFEHIFGNFEEGKGLWTSIMAGFDSVVGKSAEARNQMLAEWKFMGGRNILFKGLSDAMIGLGSIIKPIKDAFRDLFPRTTSLDLLNMTKAFGKFAEKIKIGGETASRIKSIFSGFFSILKIGWTVIKELAKFIGELVSALAPAGDGMLEIGASVGDSVTAFQEMLVAGGGIHDFFTKLTEVIKKPVEMLARFGENVRKFIADLLGIGEADSTLGRVGDRVEHMSGIWDQFLDATKKVRKVLSDVGEYIADFFKDLGSKIADAFSSGNFSKVFDVLSVGLLGGIILQLRKFLKQGLKLDLTGGFFDKINETLGTLTGTLKSMQAKLKAEALMKIAVAIGVLAVSLIALSLIDSAALTKALAATAVGFGQLVVAMALLEKATTTLGSLKLMAIGVAVVLVAAAMAILSIAVTRLAKLDWGELAKGLLGVAGAMAVMITGVNNIASDTSGMIKAGIAMIGVSIALVIMAKAIEMFGNMDLVEMAVGLGGVAVALLGITTAMKAMPVKGMLSAGLGITALAVGMLILQKAVEAFGTMDMETMRNGLLGVGGALGLVVLITNTIPAGGLVASGAGLLLVSAALIVMSKAVESMGNIPFGEMAKGIGALAVMLLILVVAANAMQGAVGGAAAIVIMSGAMYILAQVLAQLGKLSIAELITGLVALAAAIAVIAGAALLIQPAIGAMLALGVAMGILGIAFALFGAGAMLIAKAFEIIAKSGKAGMGTILEILEMGAKAIPRLIAALIQGIIESASSILEILPKLMDLLKGIFTKLLEMIIELAPKIAEALGAVLDALLDLVVEKTPELVAAGITMIEAFLTGIRDNIGGIVELAADIIINFANALAEKAPELVTAAITLLTAFLDALGSMGAEIAMAGLNLLMAFLQGIADNVMLIIDTVTLIITNFLQGITDSALVIMEAGMNFLMTLLLGISQNIILVADAVTAIILQFMTTLTENALVIMQAGVNLLNTFLWGIAVSIVQIADTVTAIIVAFITEIGENLQQIIDAGVDVLIKFIEGIERDISKIIDAGVDVVLKFLEGIGQNSVELAEGAADVLIDFLNGMATAIREKSEELRNAGKNIATAIMSGLSMGLTEKIPGIMRKVGDFAGQMKDKLTHPWEMFSPSHVTQRMGASIAEGFGVGFDKDVAAERAAEALSGRILAKLQTTMTKIPDTISGMGELNPVITPVLDLTKVQSEAGKISKMMNVSPLVPSASFARANQIATTANLNNSGSGASNPSVSQEVTFEQNIYSPTALSTSDIYRSTKSQIALAKEELKIA